MDQWCRLFFEFIQFDGLIDLKFSDGRSAQARQVSASIQRLSDIFCESSDICSRGTTNSNSDLLFVCCQVGVQQVKFMNIDDDWPAFNRFAFACELIKLLTFNLLGRVHWRHLLDLTSKPRQHAFNVTDRNDARLLIAQWFSG